nr:Asp23/Gls24 family envelope stress response protein [Veillonella denticariosi]
MNVKHRKGFLEVNIYIKALYGYNLIDLSKQLQIEIQQILKNMLDLDHVKVDVHIEGIVKEKEPTSHEN